jgi:hypothetical protein
MTDKENNDLLDCPSRLLRTVHGFRFREKEGLGLTTTLGYYDGPRWLQRSEVDDQEDQARGDFHWDNTLEHNGERIDH